MDVVKKSFYCFVEKVIDFERKNSEVSSSRECLYRFVQEKNGILDKSFLEQILFLLCLENFNRGRDQTLLNIFGPFDVSPNKVKIQSVRFYVHSIIYRKLNMLNFRSHNFDAITYQPSYGCPKRIAQKIDEAWEALMMREDFREFFVDKKRVFELLSNLKVIKQNYKKGPFAVSSFREQDIVDYNKIFKKKEKKMFVFN